MIISTEIGLNGRKMIQNNIKFNIKVKTRILSQERKLIKSWQWKTSGTHQNEKFESDLRDTVYQAKEQFHTPRLSDEPED